ncbi:hypothetical protein AUC70_11670 [Methyloceanibacter stevinii]|uniref:Uncharacterized protein n=1 Tax=Methyloceanibacter stevinii TaxID=1774970 RepID=A0A1E3VJ20_9HYPH|nr:hypothetical protein [Methyloceanibacter stevinii]ODR93517.1 hypothetical protein AUC70_11670 [Methyloceanibacter stevinii]
MIPALYSEGTIAVENGSTTITGIGTAWSTILRRGSLLRVGQVLAFIASDPSAADEEDRPGDFTAELSAPWQGPTTADPEAGEAYEVNILRDGGALAEGFTDLMERLAGKGMGLVTVGTPLDTEGRDNDFRYDPTTRLLYFKVAGTWDAFTINLRFSAYVANLAGRDAYDDEDAGFTVFLEDTEVWYVRSSPAEGTWAGPFAYRGPGGGDRYDIAYSVPGSLLSGELIGEGFLFTTDVEFDAGLLLSKARVRVAPQNEAVFSIRKVADPATAFDASGELILAESVEVGTVTFAADAKIGVFAAPAAFALEAGQELHILAPDPADPKAFGANITVTGFRNSI